MLRLSFFILFSLIMAFVTRAADYRIVFLNTPTITIGGTQMRVNEVFQGDCPVEWISPRQVMKVADTSTGEQRVIVASQYKDEEAKSIMDYLKGVRHLSTRSGLLNNPVSLRAVLSDTFFLVDTIAVATSMPTGSDCFFYVSYDYRGEEINKAITNDKGTFWITKDIFTIDGKPVNPFETEVSVFYLDEKVGKTILITDRMKVIPIPEMLDSL